MAPAAAAATWAELTVEVWKLQPRCGAVLGARSHPLRQESQSERGWRAGLSRDMRAGRRPAARAAGRGPSGERVWRAPGQPEAGRSYCRWGAEVIATSEGWGGRCWGRVPDCNSNWLHHSPLSEWSVHKVWVCADWGEGRSKSGLSCFPFIPKVPFRLETCYFWLFRVTFLMSRIHPQVGSPTCYHLASIDVAPANWIFLRHGWRQYRNSPNRMNCWFYV